MSDNQTSSRTLTPRLQVLQYAETWCARFLGGWQPGIANWEAKHQVGLHLWQDMEIARDLRTRLWELRVAKPDRFDKKPVMDALVQHLASAQHDIEAIAGLYLGLKTALCNAIRAYLSEAHETWDAPTIPLLKRACAMHESQIEWAEDISVDEVVDQCRQAVADNSLSPAQRSYRK